MVRHSSPYLGGLSSDRGGLGHQDLREVQASGSERLGGYTRGMIFSVKVLLDEWTNFKTNIKNADFTQKKNK